MLAAAAERVLTFAVQNMASGAIPARPGSRRPR